MLDFKRRWSVFCVSAILIGFFMHYLPQHKVSFHSEYPIKQTNDFATQINNLDFSKKKDNDFEEKIIKNVSNVENEPKQLLNNISVLSFSEKKQNNKNNNKNNIDTKQQMTDNQTKNSDPNPRQKDKQVDRVNATTSQSRGRQAKEIKSKPSDLARRVKEINSMLFPFWNKIKLITQELMTSQGQIKTNDKMELLLENSTTFFEEIRKFSHSSRIVPIEVKMSDIEPYLFKYEFPITRDVCDLTGSELIDKGPLLKYKHKDRFKPCQSDKGVGLCPEVFDWSKYRPLIIDNKRQWTYVSVVKYGCITNVGDYYNNEFKVISVKCNQPKSSSFIKPPTAKAIFSISQHYGAAYGHFVSENLPKLAPYLEFLRENKHIKIHSPINDEISNVWFSSFGINPDRIITGNHCADILYVPRGTRCGMPSAFEAQLLSLKLRQDNPVRPMSSRRSILFIERTQSRAMGDRRKMLELLTSLASSRNMTVDVFSDSALPSFQETKAMFNRAFMIFTNHGAGMANMIMSQPGTLIFECTIYDGFANWSLGYFAKILGHKFFSYRSKDCMTVKAEELMVHVEPYLDLHADIVSDTCPLKH